MGTVAENREEDALELASKTWNKVINVASKSGFREGVTDGSMSVFQDGFDRGYRDAFETTFLVGAYKGLANIMKIDSKRYPPQIERVLSNTRKGICQLCQNESKKFLGAATNETIEEIENGQREHAKQIVDLFQHHLDPLLKESNIDLDFLNRRR